MRLEKLQALVSEELGEWIETWGKVKALLNVAPSADSGRVMASLGRLKTEMEELKKEQEEVAKHAGFTSAGRLFQHIKAQPEGFLTGRAPTDKAVVLPEELMSANAYWFVESKTHKPIRQLQINKWLVEVQSMARKVLRDQPDLKEKMVEHYTTHHPEEFIEACRTQLFGSVEVKTETNRTDVRKQLSLILPGMNGFSEWVTKEEDRIGLQSVEIAIYSEDIALQIYNESKNKKDPDLWRLGHWIKSAAEEHLYGGPNDETHLYLQENLSRKIAWDELWDKKDRVEAMTMIKKKGLQSLEDWVEERAKEIDEE
jgi:hypothetical protein